ncbi:MAG: DUF502 domain-containing protein [Phycisphaerae bacterium]|jgi:uncharacterized membrane protein
MAERYDEKLNREIKINIRKNLISGVLIAVPFVVSLLIIQWLFKAMAGLLQPVVSRVLPWLAKFVITSPVPDTYQRIAVTTMSVILLVLLLYFVGAVGQLVIGRRFISIGEKLFMRIPIVRTIYGSSKQVIKAMSMPDRTVFKSVVLVEFPRPGMKAFGFLTGYITDPDGRKYCKIFLPTTPNPTTGFFEMVPLSDVIMTDLSIEDGFKIFISGGVVSPDTFNYVKNNHDAINGEQEQKQS